MSNIDKQALREEFQYMQDHYSDPADRERQVIYIAAEALLDELEAAEKRNTELVHNHRVHAARLINERGQLKQRIAELEARTLTIKQFDEFQICHYGASEDYAKGYIDCQNNYNKALSAAGIGKGE